MIAVFRIAFVLQGRNLQKENGFDGNNNLLDVAGMRRVAGPNSQKRVRSL
jgi:hypothetical protein